METISHLYLPELTNQRRLSSEFRSVDPMNRTQGSDIQFVNIWALRQYNITTMILDI